MALNINSLIQLIISSSMPILFAMLGETFAERSGVINLGIDGIMLISASVGFVTSIYTNIVMGLLASLAIGLFLGLIISVLEIDLHLNQSIVGIAVWIFGVGASSFIWFNLVYLPLGFGIYINVLQPVAIPLISTIPVIGGLVTQNILVYIGYILIAISYFILEKTSLGLKISATGENASGADIVGINVRRLRYLCVAISGLFAGLAGGYITLALSGSWTHNITGGSGWIAVALVRVGQWNPLLGTIGTIIFGAVTNLQFTLQQTNLPIPYEVFLSLPYIIGILSLAIFRTSRKRPKSLGLPYKRE